MLATPLRRLAFVLGGAILAAVVVVGGLMLAFLFNAKACAPKSRAQLGQVLRRREEKDIHVGGRPHDAVGGERESANYGVIDLLALQDLDCIEKQERGLARPFGSHGWCSAFPARCASAARPASCRAHTN